jgi:hypothetical protein
VPNWCSNHIQVRGSNSAEIKRLVDAFNEGKFCEQVIPVPEDLMREGTSSFGGDNAEAYDQIRAENRERHGYESWFEFCTDQWGTKWDISNNGETAEVDEDGLGFAGSFETAWSPPLGIVQALEAQGYEVVLRYHESGMCFVGKWDAGYDECYEYSGIPIKDVRQAIGDDLDDFFGITDMLEYYEEENEEELTQWIREGVDSRENV